MARQNPRDLDPKSVLVIQLRQIGDVLLCTPAVRALRQRYPGARVCFVAEPIPARVLSENKNIDEVIIRDPKAGGLEPVRTIADIRRRRFDLVVDYLANPRSALITLLSGAPVTISRAGNRRSRLYSHPVEPKGVYAADQKLSLLRVLGVEGESRELEMPVEPAARARMNAWLEEAGPAGGDGPLVCLEVFAKWPVLQYPPERHLELAVRMIEKWAARVLLTWGPGREAEARKLVEKTRAPILLAPPTDLHELAAIYAAADLWVGNDAGPRHIAASQGLPTFAVFGPTDDAWTPPGPHVSVAREDLACRPCNLRRCPENHHGCLDDFPVERVFELLDDFKSRVLPAGGAPASGEG